MAGDDIIDGDKWLDVQIGVFAPMIPTTPATPIALHNSMTTLAASMFYGSDQSRPARDRPHDPEQQRTSPTATAIADVDVAVFSGVRAEYDIDFNADGTVTVAHARRSGDRRHGHHPQCRSAGFRRPGHLAAWRRRWIFMATSPPRRPQRFAGLSRHVRRGCATTTTTALSNWAATPWVEANDSGGADGRSDPARQWQNELRFVDGDGASITAHSQSHRCHEGDACRSTTIATTDLASMPARPFEVQYSATDRLRREPSQYCKRSTARPVALTARIRAFST